MLTAPAPLSPSGLPSGAAKLFMTKSEAAAMRISHERDFLSRSEWLAAKTSYELQQNKQADVLRYHDTVAALRRYNLIDLLIDLPARVRKSSPALKRAYHREYLKGWRAKHRCAAAHADNESAGLDLVV